MEAGSDRTVVAITPVIKTPFSDMVSEEPIIIKGITIIMIERNSIINVIITEIIKNDQKFLAPFPKNSPDENPIQSLLRLLNNPAVRKAFATNPTRKTNKKPEDAEDIRVLKC